MQKYFFLIIKGDSDKKLKFIDEAEEGIGERKEEKQEDISDDILNLKVSELIWKKALSHMEIELKKHNIDSNSLNTKLIEFDNLFLNSLMKYGSQLSYKRLKEIIVNDIHERSNSLSSQSKFEKLKIEIQISNSQLLVENSRNWLISTFNLYDGLINTLKDSDSESKHFVLNQLIEYITNNYEDKVHIEKDELTKQLIDKVLNCIALPDIINHYYSEYNFSLVKFIYESTIRMGKKLSYNNELLKTIEDIIKKISSSTKEKTSNRKGYFEIYWKYLAFIKGISFDEILTIFMSELDKTITKSYKPDLEVVTEYFDVLLSIVDEVNIS